MALKVLQWSLSKPFDEGLKVEARGFARLIPTQEHKNLLHIFHLSQRPKKQFVKLPESNQAHYLKIGIIGAGVMGGGIVHLFADKNYPVRMKDIQSPMIINGLKTADTLFDYSVKRHRITRLEKQRKLESISSTLGYEGFNRLDVVIEAVAEKMTVKKQVLTEIEEIVPEHTLFASNTSALSISELQSSARFPNRVCGMHFFNPVHRMPLVEVIKGGKTDEHTVSVIFNLSKSLGKIPIIVQDSPGFLVNRLLGVYINEACLLALEGCDVQWLDAIVEKFGMPMGPFRLIDEVGIDIAVEVGAILGKAFEDRLAPSPLLKQVKSLGFQGKKTGKGFYRYSNGKRKGFNRDILQLLPTVHKNRYEDALERMMFLMINEAASCLRHGVVSSPEDVDAAMVFGAGFPPFRGGLCRWADTRGLGAIADTLKRHETALGQRFAPDSFFQENTGFYNANSSF
jgi:3-hydroxyacyl-CoA dehydrogenase/enoyl-CoA hydratase/3-hydroxybutyryl-CoA epimerase